MARLSLLPLLALLALLALSAASAAPVAGIATEFGGAADKQSRDSASLGILDGACGYGNMSRGDFPAWKAAALPPNSVLLDGLSQKLGCGVCVKVTCDPSRQLPFSPCKAGALPVTVMVVDSCPTCDKNQINVHASAFQDFLGPIPKVAVTLERVACEPRSNLVLKVTEARTSSGGFVRVAPQGVAGSGVVSKVEVRPTGSSSSWTQATNAYGASWQASKFGDGVSSLDVRLTGEPGTSPVEAVGAISPVARGRYGTAVQINGAGLSSSSAPAAAARAPAAAAPAPAAPAAGKAVEAPAPAAPAPAAPAPAKAVEAPASAAPAPAAPAPAKAVESPASAAPAPVAAAAAKAEAAAKEEAAPPPPPPAKKEAAPAPSPPPPAPKKEEVEEIPAGAESLTVKGSNIGGAGSSVTADILRSAGLAATAGR